MSSTSGAPRSEIDVDVRYKETDQMAVVHHSNYLVWFELARTHHCRQSGHPYPEIEKMGYWLMVTGAHLSYRGAARYGDRVQVSCWIEKYRSRVLHFGYEVCRDGQLLVSGTTEHTWVDQSSGTSRRIPQEVEPAFRRLAGLDGG